MDQFYLHLKDQRTTKQIQLTNNLARSLSTLNLNRLQSSNFSHSSRKDYLYVCFPGIPIIPGQFDNIGIPGEKMIIYFQGYEPGLTEEEAKQKLKYSRLQQQVAIIHERLNKRKDKPLVFIYHSYGTILPITLFRLYYADYLTRVIGMVSIGCFPIRFTKQIKQGVDIVQNDKTMDYLLQNVDLIYSRLVQRYKRYGRHNYDKNKYSYLCRVTLLSQGIGFKQMFSYMRQLPPILKCFIYGRNDQFINEDLLNQVAIYYSYRRKFQGSYEQKVRKILFQMYGMKIDNIQQRFIFNIVQGRHSLHVQKRFNKLVSNILNQYLTVIQKLHINKQMI